MTKPTIGQRIASFTRKRSTTATLEPASSDSSTPAGYTDWDTEATSRVSPLALLGSPPESRDHTGPDAGYYLFFSRIEALCTVDSGTQRPTQIGKSWLMKGCHVGHDAYIGDGCELAPHVCVGGWAEIEDNVRIGMGAIIRNRVKIGKGARIGMGAVVVKDVPAGEVWVGNPARNIQTDIRVDPLWDDWFDKSRGR